MMELQVTIHEGRLRHHATVKMYDSSDTTRDDSLDTTTHATTVVTKRVEVGTIVEGAMTIMTSTDGTTHMMLTVGDATI